MLTILTLVAFVKICPPFVDQGTICVDGLVSVSSYLECCALRS